MKVSLFCAAPSAVLSAALLVACSSAPSPVPPPASCTPLNTLRLTTQTAGAAGRNAPASGWNAPRLAGKVLLRSSGKLSAQTLNPLQGLKVKNVAAGWQQVETPAGKSDQAFAQELERAGAEVQPDFLYQPLAGTNDPGFPGNAGIVVQCQAITQTYLTRTRVPQAWDVLTSYGLPLGGALAAVLDSAVDTTHPELRGRITAQVSQVSPRDEDEKAVYEHGTAAAGIIGATGNNGQGITGTGQRQPLLLEEVITAEGASTSAVTAALDDAVRRGAKVINLSLGTPTAPGDRLLDQALTRAASSAVLVAAAGNTAVDVYYPASHPAVIAVGAVGSSDGSLAWYSARPSAPDKRALDIVAPGGDEKTPLLTLAPGNTYAGRAGTSFAAPQVSGVAALMRAANPALTAAQTRALLLAHADSTAGLPLLDAEAAVLAAMTGKE